MRNSEYENYGYIDSYLNVVPHDELASRTDRLLTTLTTALDLGHNDDEMNPYTVYLDGGKFIVAVYGRYTLDKETKEKNSISLTVRYGRALSRSVLVCPKSQYIDPIIMFGEVANGELRSKTYRNMRADLREAERMVEELLTVLPKPPQIPQ